MVRIRRQGIAIVETKKGILVVSGKGNTFALPGGGADKNESRKDATIRELKEETNLDTKKISYLFEFVGRKWDDHKDRLTENHAKVFLVEPIGKARPSQEIKKIEYYTQKSKIKLSNSSEKILRKWGGKNYFLIKPKNI